MDFSGIQAILASGGDVATIALAIAVWRLDRRVLVMETLLKGKKHELV